jgi:DNA-directed RNA polymerase specialized sigma24 family protein
VRAARDVLAEYRSARAALQSRYEAYESLMSSLGLVAASYDANVHAGHAVRDRLGDLIGDVEGRMEAVLDAARDCTEGLRDAERLIGRLHNGAQRRVLMLRYMRLMSWGEVAERMEMTPGNVANLHRRALDALDGLRAAQESEGSGG